jgi:hypothetical protein
MARVKSVPKKADRRRTIHKSWTGGGGRGMTRAQALKVTSRKGAYNPARKKQFQKRRAPFVETKQQTDQLVAAKAGVTTGTQVDTIANTVEQQQISYGTFVPGGTSLPRTLTIFSLNSFMNMNPGIGSTDLIGASCYSRYLKCKIEIQLPWGTNQIKHPCDMYLVHGFVTQPLGANDHTNPTRTAMTRQNVQDHIKEQVEEYFNQRSDKLQYIPKRTSNLKILGYRKLKVKDSHNLGPDPTYVQQEALVPYSVGSPPLINMVCKWPTKRKIHYVQGVTNLPPGPSGASLPHMYPNYAWLPFFCLYNPSAIDFLSDVTYPGGGAQTNKPPEMFIRYNSIHYFSDS